MHVVHLIHTLGPGGAEQVLVDLARAADAGGFTMSVVGLVGAGDLVNARALDEAGVPVVALGLGSRWDVGAFPRALQAARRAGAEVVHTHLKHADLVGAFVARRLGVPQVSTLHVIEDAVHGSSAAKRWVAGQVRARAAARTIAVSDAQRRWYLERFPADPRRVVTIRNGVAGGTAPTPEERHAARRSLGRPDGEVLAAQVAIMREGKGHDQLLGALAELPEGLPLHVLLVGDGPERPRLGRLVADDPRLAGRVTFTGYRSDVPALLRGVDLVVHPTLADALPTALIQALAAALPVVASDVGGVPEIVGPAEGVLVPPGDVDRLAEALEALTVDAGLRATLGAAARSRFEREFEAWRWARRLGDLYREVVAEGAPPASGAGRDPRG